MLGQFRFGRARIESLLVHLNLDWWVVVYMDCDGMYSVASIISHWR